MYFKTTDVAGLRIFYREAGDPSKPTIVLMNGFPTSSYQFHDLIPLLADRFHILGPDYPGMGFSDAPAPTVLRPIFDDVIRVIDAFIVQRAPGPVIPTQIIPLSMEQSPAKIVIDPPLAEPLASRGVVIIQYCAQNLHIAPVFGPNAVTVSPCVGHVHVSIDDASWVWADASGNPIILQGLLPGPHKVLIELVNANHQPLDKGVVAFVIPGKSAAEKHH